MTRTYRQMDWTAERIARFWAWQSRYPEQYFTYQFGDSIARHLSPWLKGRNRVLDYGCGTGFMIPHLAAVAETVIGADLSPESVVTTNARHGTIPNFAGAFTLDELRSRQERYDAITVIEVVEHLHDEDLDVLLRDVRTLLAPGGTAIFTTPNDEDLQRSFVYSPATDEVFHRYQHLRSWTEEALSMRLRAAHFETEVVFATDMSDRGWRRPHQTLLRWLERLRGAPKPKPHLVCIAQPRHEG